MLFTSPSVSGSEMMGIEFDCSRISGLVVELSFLRAMMESARGEPIALRPSAASVVIGLSPRRSEPICHQSVGLETVGDGCPPVVDGAFCSGGGSLMVRSSATPHGPGDPSEFVGECDGGLVMAAALFVVECPEFQGVACF